MFRHAAKVILASDRSFKASGVIGLKSKAAFHSSDIVDFRFAELPCGYFRIAVGKGAFRPSPPSELTLSSSAESTAL
jgi:hypothetical protein